MPVFLTIQSIVAYRKRHVFTEKRFLSHRNYIAKG